jgi:hypothetical protein
VSLALIISTVFAVTARAQNETAQPRASAAAPAVTASTSAERLRVVSPEQSALRLEFFSESGAPLFDTDFRPGSLLDFRRNDAGGALPDGTHLLVVTTRDLQGRVRQRLAALRLDGARLSVAPADEEKLSHAQAKALADARAAHGIQLSGTAPPVAVIDGLDTQAVTLATHDGREGQLTSTAGPLTLRTGDVLKGGDVERVRVTEDGRVGIGTNSPQAALDVAGEIRARGGVRFEDGSLLTSANGGGGGRPGQGLTGTNRLAKFTDSSGTLADSAVTESNGNVGVGTADPALPLDVSGSGRVGQLVLARGFAAPGKGGYLFAGSGGPGAIDAELGFFVANDGTGGGANEGPYFNARGNAFSRIPNQRGSMFFLGGSNLPSPGPGEGQLRFFTNGAERLTIAYGGNVGVGTASPQSRLHVEGDVRVAGAGSGVIFADGTKQTTAAASTAGQNAWTGQNTFVNGLSANGVAITNVGNPVSATDATNKAYVDATTVRFVPGAEQLSVGDANGTAPMINLRGGSTCCSGPGGHTPAWFKVFQNGSFVATGNLGIGVSPMQGKGYRTSWDSYKGAFRSGYADAEWDDANVGFFSWAGGSNSTAIGLYALAFGDTNSAESTSSIVFGSGNQVKGAAGFSAGAGNRVCDTYGVALGNNAKSGGPLINGRCDPDTFNIRGLAAVAIGYNVTADQDHTTAMGKFASNNGFTGTFIWSDGSAQQTADTFRNTANNEFAARATGGFRFRTNLGGTTGCNLPAGSGVFNCTSSRTTKENFAEVSGNDVLARLRKVPVSTWNYIAEGQQSRHLGPMAEDFYSAFQLGTTDKAIGVQDLAGVSLAAVKALDARTSELQTKTEELQRKSAEVEQLRSQVQTLEQRLAALEAAIRAKEQK